MNVSNKSIFIALTIILSSCASNTFKEKTYRNMLIASAIGTIAAQSEKSNKLGYAVAYAGTAAAVAAIASIEYYDPDKELERRTGMSREMANSIENSLTQRNSAADYFNNKSQSAPSLKNYGSLPSKYKNLVKPGEWKISQIDEWEQIDDMTFVHKTELFELIPPQFNLNK